MKLNNINPQFVEFIPRHLDEGVLYISRRYSTASHLCACGCGEKVVTPLSPVDWKLNVTNNNVSLSPSVGNWNYKCQSHYWIRDNKIVWARKISKEKIAHVQARDRADKHAFIAHRNKEKDTLSPPQPSNCQHDNMMNHQQPITLLSIIWNAITSLWSSFKK